MNQLITTKPVDIVLGDYCGHCGNQTAQTDNFCRRCGSPCTPTQDAEIVNAVVIGSQNAPSTELTNSVFTVDKFLKSRSLVLGAIALVGPLGLPALWFSPRFSPTSKTIITSLYVVLSVVVPFAIIWYWLDFRLQPLLDVIAQ